MAHCGTGEILYEFVPFCRSASPGTASRFIERNPVEIVLGRILGRRHEIHLTGLFVNMTHPDHVHVAGGEP